VDAVAGTGYVVMAMTADELQRRLDEMGWYHTVDIAPGVATKGMFDNRHALSVIPFPDLRGKRCLDIGTCDGLFAFHMEREGAAEVIAIDLPDFSHLDYPPEIRDHPTYDRSQSDLRARRGGFRMLHEALGSKVVWRGSSVYDLNPEELGQFDVVVMGSLLLHLRDPVRALDAIRKVVRGYLVVAEHVHTPLTVWSRRRPLFELRGEGSDFQWWVGNDRGVQQLLHVGGYAVEAWSRYFVLRFGQDWIAEYFPRSGWREGLKDVVNRALTGDRHRGHLHRAYRCRPRC
jgi:tRNA (mo5U34)-methyltransferase